MKLEIGHLYEVISGITTGSIVRITELYVSGREEYAQCQYIESVFDSSLCPLKNGKKVVLFQNRFKPHNPMNRNGANL